MQLLTLLPAALLTLLPLTSAVPCWIHHHHNSTNSTGHHHFHHHNHTLHNSTTHGNHTHKKAGNSNWGGASLLSSDSSNVFTGVSADVVVPTPNAPGGASDGTTYTAYVWVGMDGIIGENSASLLQTGFNINIEAGSNTVNCQPWYEWYPAPYTAYGSISCNVGDTIQMYVQSSDPTGATGTVGINNLSSGESASEDLSSPNGYNMVPGSTVEWIVEDPESIPFPGFSQIVFTNAQATTSDGSTVGADGASIFTITENGVNLAEASASGSTVTVNYVGP